MEDPQAMAGAAEIGEGLAGAPLVLIEDDEGQLRVVHRGTGLFEPATLADARLDDLVPSHDRSSLAGARAAARDGRQADCLVSLAADDGTTRWFELRYLPGIAAEGLVVLLRDVTHLRRLAAEAAVLRRITELANSVADADEAIDEAVADLRATIGWRAGRALRVEDGQLVDDGRWAVAEGADELPGRVAAVAATGTDVAAAALERGTVTTLGDVPGMSPEAGLQELGAAPVVAVPVLAGDDVTHVLEFHAGAGGGVDEERRGLLEQVGRQLGWVVLRQRYLEQLEASHTELARSNAELERFAYVASHDLQEPLRKIIGFTELLQDHHEPLDEDEEEYRRYVVESAHRLQRLIKDLLAYSRAGRRELAAEPVDLAAVVDGVLADLAPAIEETGATVEVGELPVVSGDEGQLREVLQNLVSNALKYHAEGRDPVIRITEAAPVAATDAATDEAGEAVQSAEGGDLAHVVVADNGIGIETDHRESVFEVFRRLHPAHLYGGTGLGLALVQRIVVRHGGAVSIGDSPFGAGIAVHLQLPRTQDMP